MSYSVFDNALHMLRAAINHAITVSIPDGELAGAHRLSVKSALHNATQDLRLVGSGIRPERWLEPGTRVVVSGGCTDDGDDFEGVYIGQNIATGNALVVCEFRAAQIQRKRGE